MPKVKTVIFFQKNIAFSQNVLKKIPISVILNNNTFVDVYKRQVFSDGTSVTAQDCVYSFNKAKAEGSIYASRFIYIKSYVAQSHNVFVITFTDASLNNVNLLEMCIRDRARLLLAFL